MNDYKERQVLAASISTQSDTPMSCTVLQMPFDCKNLLRFLQLKGKHHGAWHSPGRRPVCR